MIKFDIYNEQEQCYIKTDCSLIAVIGAGYALSDDEIRRFYEVDEDHPYWKSLHRPGRVVRYVFDKCIIPDNPKFKIIRSDDYA